MGLATEMSHAGRGKRGLIQQTFSAGFPSHPNPKIALDLLKVNSVKILGAVWLTEVDEPPISFDPLFSEKLV